MTEMKCRFEGCASTLSVATAWVPELAVLRRKAGEVSVKTLAEHAHCGRHAAQGRREGLRFYSYQGTVLELEKRRAERAQAKGYFAGYGQRTSGAKPANKKEKKA